MNKLEADELLNLALMSKIPCVIVEGVDDIRVYEGIAQTAKANCEVYSVDMLEGLTGGSEGVVEALRQMHSVGMPVGKAVEQFVVGIIDGDVRPYRGDMPAVPSLLILRYYSIESHFASRSIIGWSLSRITRTSAADEVDDGKIFDAVHAGLKDLYYFALDAIKGAVDSGYCSVIGFSSSVGRRRDPATIASLGLRRIELDAFAADLGLDADISSMRSFVKGKWLLTAFAEELFNFIESLPSKCKSASILRCRMCKVHQGGPCLYQLRSGMNKNALYSILTDFFDVPELDYIKARLQAVAQTAGA